ncbi:Z-ring formation inhibitor MciZ [Alkalihalobacterium bogoriense]|nr:Z-ring formation inhibitor MciZ [Alkalihalobacterium bogoriense]
MKVYVTANGVTIVGKAWQVQAILKQYAKQYKTIEQWKTAISPKQH